MNAVTLDQLRAYLEDALSDTETAQLEQQLRVSEPLREQLRLVMQQRDRGVRDYGSSRDPSTSRTGVSGINPPRRRASVSSPLKAHCPATARWA